MHIKDFDGWSKVKQDTDDADHLPTFNEREIWWCKIGVNIGHEIDGKNQLHNRPVLIVKKFNTRLFWGVALSTKIKDDKNYFLIEVKGRKQSVMLSHLRLYDSKRIHSSLIATLPQRHFEEVRKELIKLIS